MGADVTKCGIAEKMEQCEPHEQERCEEHFVRKRIPQCAQVLCEPAPFRTRDLLFHFRLHGCGHLNTIMQDRSNKVTSCTSNVPVTLPSAWQLKQGLVSSAIGLALLSLRKCANEGKRVRTRG